MNKAASKGASRKAGAAKKSRTRKRSDAKRRKAPASRSATTEERELAKAERDKASAIARQEVVEKQSADQIALLKKRSDARQARISKRLARASQDGVTDLAKEKSKRLEYRIAAQAWPRAKWVALIKDPKQRALASAAEQVCAIFGIAPDVLRADRKDQSPRSRNENSFRGVALGAVIDVGIAIGLGWNEMHTHPDTGRSEVIDLPPHAATIRGAHERWTAAQAMDGIALEVAKQRVALIRTAAVKAASVGK